MKSIVVALTLAGLVSVALGEIHCTADICSRIKCSEELTETLCLAQPHHRYDPKGGFCHCCPACINVHQLGEDCHDTIILGPVKKAECAQGLRCDLHSKKCVPMGTVPSFA